MSKKFYDVVKQFFLCVLLFALLLSTGCGRGGRRHRGGDGVSPLNTSSDFILPAFTESSTIILNLSATDNVGVTGYYASEGAVVPDLANSGWVHVDTTAAFSEDVEFTLSPGKAEVVVDRIVYVWFSDGAGNISTDASDSISLGPTDKEPPVNRSVDFISNSSESVDSTRITLGLSASDNTTVTAYLASEDSLVPPLDDSGWISVEPAADYNESVSFFLSPGTPGTVSGREVHVWFRDGAGNISVLASDTVNLVLDSLFDIDPPLNNSENFISADTTSSAVVSLSLSASDNEGVAGYYISDDPAQPAPNQDGWTTFEPVESFSADVDFTLDPVSPGETADVTVYVWFIDGSGNISSATSDTIELMITDFDPPLNQGADFINAGVVSTQTPNVTLDLSAVDEFGVTGYLVSESSAVPGLTDSGWAMVESAASYSASVVFELSHALPGETVERTVFVWFRDGAGLISETASDSISLVNSDTGPPVNSSLDFINSGADATETILVSLSLFASDDVGVTGYYISEEAVAPLPADSGWVTLESTLSYEAVVEFILSAADADANLTRAVYVWFRDAAGGISDMASDTITLTRVKVLVVAAGFRHSLAVRSDSSTWGWGDNGSGQLGNDTVLFSLLPVQVSALAGISSIAGGGWANSLALKDDGTVWSWGYNGWGELGNGTTEDSAIPIQVMSLSNVVQIAGGEYHALALRSDGTVWSWGRNDSGQLGDGTFTMRSTPVLTGGLTGVVALSSKGRHSMALTDDGAVWSWGSNLSGQLGDGTGSDSSTPLRVAGLSDVVTIGVGLYHSIAVKTDGTVWSWGDNTRGQLGDGTNIDRLTPVQVAGLSNVTAAAGGEYHSIVLKGDGTVWSWGWNTFGQLGDGTTTDRFTPVQVLNLDDVIGLDSGWWHNIAVKSSGMVYTWGNNDRGNLGDGTDIRKLVPVWVEGL